VAKTRAQRKAERRAREAAERKRSGDGGRKHDGDAEARAQHDTQVPVSGDIAEVEAMEAGMGVGAPEADLETPDAPQPSRAQRRAEAKQAKEAEKRKRTEQKRQEREQLARRQKQAQAERQRGGVIGFLASCWAELRKVQWPDRETLVQATAVTIIFVAVAGAYLGALDSAFSFLIKQIL
jgi:preprotein translocase SecE subunit